MQTLRYILMRLAKAAVILFAIVILNFCLIHAAPGDPAAVMAGEAGASDELFLQQLREKFGLDQPFHIQLWKYISGLLQLDMGYSYRQDAPVWDLIMDRLPATLLLTGAAFVLSIVLGVVAGVMAAVRVGKWADTAITVAALLLYATPLFWVALMAILLFSVQLGWFPSYGMESIGSELTGFRYWLDVAHHLVLPALTLGLIYLAFYSRLSRTSMLEVLETDYVRTARAKGLPKRLVIYKHALRNAVLPVVTFAGLQFGQVISGAVLVETVFAWPGLGTLAFESILRRDTPTLLGILFFSALMVVVMNLLTDVIYRRIDPRIKAT